MWQSMVLAVQRTVLVFFCIMICGWKSKTGFTGSRQFFFSELFVLMVFVVVVGVFAEEARLSWLTIARVHVGFVAAQHSWQSLALAMRMSVLTLLCVTISATVVCFIAAKFTSMQ